MQLADDVGRVEAVAHIVVRLPEQDAFVFPGGAGSDFGARHDFVEAAKGFFIVFGDDNDVRFRVEPAFARERFESVHRSRRVRPARETDQHVADSIFTRNITSVVAQDVAFAVGRLRLDAAFKLLRQSLRLLFLAQQFADAGETLLVLLQRFV